MKYHNKIIFTLIFAIVLTNSLYADDGSLQLPNIEEYTLKNGMRILFSQNYDYPTVYCHLYINCGTLDDPQNGGRLAKMVENKITEATAKYPKEGEILEKMQSFGDDGGRFDHKIINEYSFELGSYFLKEDTKPALELYADILQHPLYSTKKKFWIRLIYPFIPKKNFHNKRALSRAHLDQLYANIKRRFDLKSYLKFNTSDMKNWHDDYIHPGNTTLMITGDVNFLYIKKIIENYFGDWTPTKQSSERAKYNINFNDKSNIKVRFVNTDFLDAEIRIMLKSASNEDEWYLSSELAKTVFNPGSSIGRLNAIHQELDNYGTIGQRASNSARLPWTKIEGKIKYNNLQNFYDLIISEFKSLSNNSINEVELESAKKIISNNIKYKLNKPKDFTHFIQSEYNVNGYSLEKIKGGLKKLNEVSLDAVNNAAARIYNPKNFILLVMGNQDSCATFLEQFEDVEYYEHTEELRASASSP